MNTILNTNERTTLMRAILLILVCVTVLATTTEHADAGPIFSTHAIAGAFETSPMVDSSSGEVVFYRLVVEGDDSAVIGLHSVDSGTVGNASEAIAGANASKLLRTYASAFATGAGLFDPLGGANGTAAWRDVVYPLIGTPAVLRFNFSLSGILIVADGGPQHSLNAVFSLFRAHDLISANALFNNFDRVFGGNGMPNSQFVDLVATLNSRGLGEDLPPRIQFSTRGDWEPTLFPNGVFLGNFYIDVPYDESIAGYAFGLGLSSQAFAIQGEAISNAQSTLVLQSVTLPDGTAVDVTFESGLTFEGNSAVPEPSSMALLALGGLTLLGLARRRKNGIGKTAAV